MTSSPYSATGFQSQSATTECPSVERHNTMGSLLPFSTPSYRRKYRLFVTTLVLDCSAELRVPELRIPLCNAAYYLCGYHLALFPSPHGHRGSDNNVKWDSLATTVAVNNGSPFASELGIFNLLDPGESNKLIYQQSDKVNSQSSQSFPRSYFSSFSETWKGSGYPKIRQIYPIPFVSKASSF